MAEPKAIYPSLRGKTVLITGGASGIGECMVRNFVQQDARVGFLDFNAEAGSALARELGATTHFESVDLRDIAALRTAVDGVRRAFGPIEILVNNAARDDRHTIDQVTPEYWRERMATNLDHQFFTTQAVYPDMVQKGGGSIVCMGSISFLASADAMVAYKTAKSAVVGLTRSLARELGGHNIRVNSVVPGWIMTQRQIDLWLTPMGEAGLLERQCVKRKLVPQDIADVVLFLSSDAASAISSQNYLVDGGSY